MKKHDKKRLILTKEQLRVLRTDLAHVAGAQPTLTLRCGGEPTDCCSNRIICPTH